jgi:solute carrier family 50 protein (sugar transporter)
MSTQAIITGIVCPLFGSIIANAMWLTPLPAVLEVRKSRKLGELNPYPFVVTVINCVGWTMYGCLRRDLYIFASNIFGMSLGAFYTITALSVTAQKTTDEPPSEVYGSLEGLLIFALFFWGVIGIVGATAFQSFADPLDQAATLVGTIGCACSIAYYAAPLAVMYKVIVTKDSSSIYFPLVCINVINAFLWFAYGAIALQDINVWLPNGLGLLLGFLQGFLTFIFPSKATAGKPSAFSGLFSIFGHHSGAVKGADGSQFKFADILDADPMEDLEKSKANDMNTVKNPMR